VNADRGVLKIAAWFRRAVGSEAAFGDRDHTVLERASFGKILTANEMAQQFPATLTAEMPRSRTKLQRSATASRTWRSELPIIRRDRSPQLRV